MSNPTEEIPPCPTKEKRDQLPSIIILNKEEMDEMERNSNKIPPKPRIAKPHYLRRQLEKDKEYLYCTCGFAKESQPFCDWTCKNSGDEIQGWAPMRFKVTVNQTAWALCGCKRTGSKPMCDGSHIDLDW
jgi:CDGSH-type Zn-finger protein